MRQRGLRGCKSVNRTERKSAAGWLSKAYSPSNEAAPVGAATMRPVDSRRMAEAGRRGDQLGRPATDAGRKDQAPTRQCPASTEAASHPDFDRRDAVETASRTTQTRRGLRPCPTVAAAEPASAVRRRTDPVPREETMAAATTEEISADSLSNGRDPATVATASGSLPQRQNWVHLG